MASTFDPGERLLDRATHPMAEGMALLLASRTQIEDSKRVLTEARERLARQRDRSAERRAVLVVADG